MSIIVRDTRADRRRDPLSQRTRQTFINARGWCTRYALACGYSDRVLIRQDIDGDGITVQLWYEPDSFFHVRVHDHDLGCRILWEVFDNITDARKCFMRAVKQIIDVTRIRSCVPSED